MSNPSETESKRRSRLRWVTLGEAIAIAALILSGLGLWHQWNKREEAKIIVEKPTAIPLALRARAVNNGRALEITPIEDSHALQSLTLTAVGLKVELGSDGELSSGVLEDALGQPGDAENRQGLRVRIVARYVEAGADKTATGSYVLTYKWEGGGLFGGKSLRLVGLSR